MSSVLRNRFQTDGAATISQERLLLALYDRVVTDLDGATAAIRGRQPAEAHEKLVHAQEILERAAPGPRPAGVGRRGEPGVAVPVRHASGWCTANLRKDAAPVLEVKALIEPLAASWRERLRAADRRPPAAPPAGPPPPARHAGSRPGA